MCSTARHTRVKRSVTTEQRPLSLAARTVERISLPRTPRETHFLRIPICLINILAAACSIGLMMMKAVWRKRGTLSSLLTIWLFERLVQCPSRGCNSHRAIICSMVPLQYSSFCCLVILYLYLCKIIGGTPPSHRNILSLRTQSCSDPMTPPVSTSYVKV
jgi:hypothetical protein